MAVSFLWLSEVAVATVVQTTTDSGERQAYGVLFITAHITSWRQRCPGKKASKPRALTL
jgi:hypothetical protein